MDQALFARQQRMKALGIYTAPVDGDPGPATERAYDALVAFMEKAKGIKPPLYPRLTSQHAYLRDLSPLPLITVAALDMLGTVEVPGRDNSPVIMGWADYLNLPRAVYSGDAIAWCGLFMAYCAAKAGKDLDPVGGAQGALWALNWAKFGVAVDKAHPMLGDVMVWKRAGGGHVNQYVGESVEDGVRYFHGVGGNQSDAVNISKRRADVGLVAVRRPAYRNQPATVRAYVAGSGAPISQREA